MDRAIGDAELDTVSDKLAFINVHYFAAGATLFGGDAKGMVQYEGKEYVGAFMHTEAYNSCSDCHDAHQLDLDPASCKTCHGVEDPAVIRMNLKGDYDGDGNVEEGLKAEVEGVQEVLLKAIQGYAAEVSEKPILYSPASYPYVFNDTNANGTLDADEATPANQYKSFIWEKIIRIFCY